MRIHPGTCSTRPWSWSLYTVLFLLSLVSLETSVSHAAEVISVPAGASDSEACGIIEQAHAAGLALWGKNDLRAALATFRECERLLKQRGLWAPPKLPEQPTEADRRILEITNRVVFSLAAIYQKMGFRALSNTYADMARERHLLPRVVSPAKLKK